LTIAGSGVVVFMDIFFPRTIATFFHHALTEDDVIFEVSVYAKMQKILLGLNFR
jgi:hypothetical protein